jgi:hypothetical protein
MAKEPTKAELLAHIADLEAAQDAPREMPEDALVRAFARLAGNHDAARNVRHLFYSNVDGNVQMSFDMHEPKDGTP